MEFRQSPLIEVEVRVTYTSEMLKSLGDRLINGELQMQGSG